MNPHPVVLKYANRFTTRNLVLNVAAGRRRKPFRFLSGSVVWSSSDPGSMWYNHAIATLNAPVSFDANQPEGEV